MTNQFTHLFSVLHSFKVNSMAWIYSESPRYSIQSTFPLQSIQSHFFCCSCAPRSHSSAVIRSVETTFFHSVGYSFAQFYYYDSGDCRRSSGRWTSCRAFLLHSKHSPLFIVSQQFCERFFFCSFSLDSSVIKSTVES